jgi:hypothetical protein
VSAKKGKEFHVATIKSNSVIMTRKQRPTRISVCLRLPLKAKGVTESIPTTVAVLVAIRLITKNGARGCPAAKPVEAEFVSGNVNARHLKKRVAAQPAKVRRAT